MALSPHRPLRLQLLGELILSHVAERNFTAADRIAADLEREMPEDPLARTLRALAAAYAVREPEARALRVPLTGRDGRSSEAQAMAARVHLLLGNREAALAALEQGAELDVVDPDELRTDPLLSTLAGDLRRGSAARIPPWPCRTERPRSTHRRPS